MKCRVLTPGVCVPAGQMKEPPWMLPGAPFDTVRPLRSTVPAWQPRHPGCCPIKAMRGLSVVTEPAAFGFAFVHQRGVTSEAELPLPGRCTEVCATGILKGASVARRGHVAVEARDDIV